MVSMLGSVFSHTQPIHLVLNMGIFYSLVTAMPIDSYEFLHLYVTGGLVASLGSYLNGAIRHRFTKSLGASGAIIALAGYTAAKFPDTKFTVPLVNEIYPHSFSASTAFWVMVGLDTGGLLVNWKLFDHAAHLSGIWFGKLSESYLDK